MCDLLLLLAGTAGRGSWVLGLGGRHLLSRLAADGQKYLDGEANLERTSSRKKELRWGGVAGACSLEGALGNI